MILLDTNVMSEVRHPRGAAAVKAWMSALDRDTTFISVVSVAEIAKGVHRLSPGPRRSELADWLHETKLIFADRILPVDADAAEFCGERQGMAMSKGLTVSFPDSLIAATARTKGLRVATRNVADLIAAGASVYDPWTGSMHEPAP